MKRLLSLTFILFLSFSYLQAMDLAADKLRPMDVRTSIFDRVPTRIAGYLYGLPQFFSIKQQLLTYGIASEDGAFFKHLDAEINQEVSLLFKEAGYDSSLIFIMALNPKLSADTPGFVVTSGGVFIDQLWWNTICASQDDSPQAAAHTREIKKFFVALMIEQLRGGDYRKQLATKMLVDGVLVSMVIGVATYTLAPSLCSWFSGTLPGTQWLSEVPSLVATTAQQTCDQFYSPSLCIMAGKTAWSSLLAPGVGTCVHALLTEPVAQYLAHQSCNRALESIINRQALADYCTRVKSEGKNSDQFNALVTMVEDSSIEDYVQAEY